MFIGKVGNVSYLYYQFVLIITKTNTSILHFGFLHIEKYWTLSKGLYRVIQIPFSKGTQRDGNKKCSYKVGEKIWI